MPTSLKILPALWAAAAGAAGESGLAVVSFGWKYGGYAQAEVVRGRRSGHTPSVKRGTDYYFKYRATAVVKNGGAKSVRAVEWAYVFVAPEGGRELKRFRLQPKQAIGPGATATLAKDVSIRPGDGSRHLMTGRRQVVVTRVEYADGPAWEGKE